MRRGVLVLALLALFSISLPAFAQNRTARVTADRANLREKPSTDSAVVVTLNRGTELDVLEQTGTWYRVRVKSTGREGYMSNIVLEMVGGAAAPASTPAAAPAARPATPPPPNNPPPPPPPAAPRTTTQRSTAPATSAKRQITPIGYAGIFPAYGATGFGFGGGGAMALNGHPEMEIQADALFSIHPSYLSAYYSNSTLKVLHISGNFIYNFVLPSNDWKPYVGGGIVFTHAWWSLPNALDQACSIANVNCNSVDVGGNVHFIGGIKKPLSSGREFRGEIRSGPFGTAILAGISF